MTNGGGVDLQIGHELGVFAACATLGQQIHPANLSNNDVVLDIDRDDPQASGWRLRVRIESLLI